MNGSKVTVAFLGVMIMLAMAFPVSAGTITSVASVSGGGTATVTPIITTTPDNDDATVPGGNIVVASKVFDMAKPIDIVFNVAASNGVTEYYIAEGVANNTSSIMTSYTFELGFGVGSSFTPSTPGDGLDFDTPGNGAAGERTPTPTSGTFVNLSHGDDMLAWSGGNGLGTVVSDAFTLSIDVPNLDSFTLRQWGTPVPEPGTLALAALIGCALTALGMRKRLG